MRSFRTSKVREPNEPGAGEQLMSSNFVVEQQDGITTIRPTRPLSAEELLQVMADVAELDVGNRRLWDVTRSFDFTADEIRSAASQSRMLWQGAARVAFVAEDDPSFGQMRMFEVFREQENFQTRVFRDEISAREWLLDWKE